MLKFGGHVLLRNTCPVPFATISHESCLARRCVGRFFFTTLWFPFASRMSAYCWQKDMQFGHVQKMRSNFHQCLVKSKRTSDRLPLQNGYEKMALGAKFRTRWKLYKMALEFLIFFEEHKCKFLTICWMKIYQNRCG